MDLVIICFCCACAEKAPKPSSARKTPARTTNRPIKTRRLKKADCDVDFFIEGTPVNVLPQVRFVFSFDSGFIFLFPFIFCPTLDGLKSEYFPGNRPRLPAKTIIFCVAG